MNTTLESVRQGRLEDFVRHLHVRVHFLEASARQARERAPLGRPAWYGLFAANGIRRRCIADMAATVEMALLLELLPLSATPMNATDDHPLTRIYWDTLECGLTPCVARMRQYAYHGLPVVQEGFTTHAEMFNIRITKRQVEAYIQKQERCIPHHVCTFQPPWKESIRML